MLDLRSSKHKCREEKEKKYEKCEWLKYIFMKSQNYNPATGMRYVGSLIFLMKAYE